MRVSFIVPGNAKDVSGGHIYNRKLAECADDIDIIYCNTIEELLSELTKDHQYLLIDAWALHDISLKDINQNFHLLAHHPISLDQSIQGDETKEIAFWKKANSIITTSKFVKDYIEGFCSTPVHCITPGVDYINSTREYPELPKSINGYGSVIERKGDLLLIEALKNVGKITINRFGPQTDTNHLEKVIKASKKIQSSRIEFNGLLSEEDKNTSIKNTDLAVFPTFYESYGMAIQECLNAKTPVLTSDTKGMKTRFGNQGIRYIKQDANSWSAALKMYAQNTKKYLELTEEIKGLESNFESWNEKSQQLLRILNPI